MQNAALTVEAGSRRGPCTALEASAEILSPGKLLSADTVVVHMTRVITATTKSLHHGDERVVPMVDLVVVAVSTDLTIRVCVSAFVIVVTSVCVDVDTNVVVVATKDSSSSLSTSSSSL